MKAPDSTGVVLAAGLAVLGVAFAVAMIPRGSAEADRDRVVKETPPPCSIICQQIPRFTLDEDGVLQPVP